MRRLLVFLVVAPAVLVAVIAAGIAAGSTGGGRMAQATQLQTIAISATGQHDPANMAVRPGVPVRLTIVNHEATAHTFAIPELGVNQVVPPARGGVAARVVVKFTAPYGVFRWECPLCPDESGYIYSVITKRAPTGIPPGGFHWNQA